MTALAFVDTIRRRPRRKSAAGVAFPLAPTGPAIGYTANDALVVPGSVNANEMSAEFVICTRTTDREQDIIEPAGCLQYLDDYKRNPVVLFEHDEKCVVGLSEDRSKRFSWRISDDRIVAKCFFHGLPLRGENVSEEMFRLVERGIFRGASVGLLPVESRPRAYGRNAGQHVTVWRPIEWSITSQPVNQEALRLALSRNYVKTKSLRSRIEAAAGPKPAWSHGWTPPTEKAMKPRTVAITFDSQFSEADAREWLGLHGYTAKSFKSLPNGETVFSLGNGTPTPGSRKSLANGVMALLTTKAYDASKDKDDEDEEGRAMDDEMMRKADEPVSEPDDVDVEPAPDDAIETEAETEPEGMGDDVSAKPGAQDLAAIVAHYNALAGEIPAMLARNENPSVVEFFQQLQYDADQAIEGVRAVFEQAYPGADLDAIVSGMSGEADATIEADGPMPAEDATEIMKSLKRARAAIAKAVA